MKGRKIKSIFKVRPYCEERLSGGDEEGKI